MTSKSIQESRFIAAPDTQAPADSDTEASLSESSRKRRQSTVYDAVAGLVTSELRKDVSSRSGRSRKRHSGTSGRDPVLAPEEVLFQRRQAPQRYAEHDIYFANEHQLPDAGRDVLPDSDMLKAVHSYASDFYEAMARRRGGDSAQNDCFIGSRHVDERSMDETALLAFGILLEEAGRDVLGRRGDLVFTEGLLDVADGAQGDHERGMDAGEEGQGMQRRGSRGAASSSREVSVGLEGEEFWRRRLPKRRKVAEDADG